MSAAYENAKRVALGLVREQSEGSGDDLWNISLGGGFSIAAEMPFQFFERGFEPLEEQVMQKNALKLYDDEYEADKAVAENRLETLKTSLKTSDLPALKSCLNEVHPEEWLTLIFLDGEKLKNELVPLLESTSSECKTAFSGAMDKALKRLVDFKNLFETLMDLCGE